MDVNVVHSTHFLNFEVRVPNHYSGQTRGLLGNMDGNMENEFYRRGSSEPSQDSGLRLKDRDLLEILSTCKQLSVIDNHGSGYL